jgi:hypothetical protein
VGGGWLPFGSAAEAMAGDAANSAYVQFSGGEWQVKALASAAGVEAAVKEDAGWTKSDGGAVKGAVVLLRGTFKRPFAWIDREQLIRIEGADAPYEVYVGARRVGFNASPRVGADFDVTKVAQEGNNTLTLALYTELAERSISGVRGEACAPTRVCTFSQPVVRVRDILTSTAVTDGTGALSIGVILKSSLLGARESEVYYELLGPDGRMVDSGHKGATLRLRGEDTVRFTVTIPDVKTWGPASPLLYTLQLRTQYEGRYGEHLALRVGFRSVAVADGALVLNGRPQPLHIEEMTPPADAASAARLLMQARSREANMIALRGYPATADFYTLCDMLGLMVCPQAEIELPAAAPYAGPGNDPRLEPLFLDRVETMYNASKGHPSVVMFSIAGGAGNGNNLYNAYVALKRLEAARPVAFVGAGGEWNSDAAADGSNGRIRFAPSSFSVGPASAPIDFTFDPATKRAAVRNNMSDRTVYRLGYRVYDRRKLIREGSFAVDIAPGRRVEVAPPVGKLKFKPSRHKLQLSLFPEQTFAPGNGLLEKLITAAPVWYDSI